MSSQITKTAKHTIIYGIGGLFGKGIGFLMIPIYTHIFTTGDYGILQLLSMTVDVVAIVLGTGLTMAMSRFYYQHEDEDYRRKIISTGFLTVIGIYLIGFVLTFNLSGYFSMLLFDTYDYSPFFRIMFISLLFSSGIEVPLAFLRIKQKSTQFVVLVMAKVVMRLSLNITFVVFLGYGVLGVLYSTLISNIVMSVSLSVLTFREIGFKYSPKYSIEMIRFGAPMILTLLGAFIINYSDCYFIKHYFSMNEVGVYALGYKFGWMISFLILAPFGQIWYAKMYELYKLPEAPEIYARIFSYLNIVMIIAGLGISLFAKEIIQIVSVASYWEASRIIPIVVLAYIINGWFIFTTMGILLKKKTMYAAYITIFAAVTNLGLNYFLVPTYSIYGAAWSTVFTIFLRFALSYCVSQKLYRIPYSWYTTGFLLIIGGILYFVSVNINLSSALLMVGFKILLFLFFCILVVLLELRLAKHVLTIAIEAVSIKAKRWRKLLVEVY